VGIPPQTFTELKLTLAGRFMKAPANYQLYPAQHAPTAWRVRELATEEGETRQACI